MFGSVAPILDKDDDESPYGDAFKVIKFVYITWKDNWAKYWSSIIFTIPIYHIILCEL